MNTLILIDANNALYRFGFAHKSLTNSEGMPTGAVYGILDAILRLKKQYPDGQFILVWDGPGKTWRHKMYAGYKSNRLAYGDKPPEVVAVLNQREIVRELVSMIGIQHMEVPCVEADDMIGMTAVLHRAFNLPVVVYSSDKDFMQLMSAGVTVIKPTPFFQRSGQGRMEPESEASVMKRFGCKPEEILKLRAFAGDTSDAIPVAVPGIGEKRALECLKAGADPSQDKVTCAKLKWYSKIRTGWPDVRRNYRLMQIAALPQEDLFGAETVRLIRAEMKRVANANRMWWGEQDEVLYERYWLFVRALVQHDLWEAIEHRYRLWQVQPRELL